MDSQKYDAWHIPDLGLSPAGKAKLKELRSQGFTTRAVSEDELNRKYQSLSDKKKAPGGMRGLVFILKGE